MQFRIGQHALFYGNKGEILGVLHTSFGTLYWFRLLDREAPFNVHHNLLKPLPEIINRWIVFYREEINKIINTCTFTTEESANAFIKDNSNKFVCVKHIRREVPSDQENPTV